MTSFWTQRKRKAAVCACRAAATRCPASRVLASDVQRFRKAKAARDRARMRRQASVDIERLKAAFGPICQYCREEGGQTGLRGDGRSMNLSGEYAWTIDRIDPEGSYDATNVTLACARCNSSKHTRRIIAGAVASLAEVEACHV